MKSRLEKTALLLIALLLAGFCTALGRQWFSNPDLSHGLFMPVVFFFLLHEARSQASPRYVAVSPGWQIFTHLLLAAGLGVLALAGLYTAALEWSHPLVGLALAVGVALLLTGALLVFARADVRAIPLSWSSLLAAGLWILCAPIPPGTYTRLTLALQLWVSERVVDTLHLIGVAAERQGNIITMARATVGIEEACSGVRSLVSCAFVGLFFSGALVRRPRDRVLIVAIAAPLAIGMNFVRSLALTLLANSGVNIAGTWHDVTGFAVLGVTAVLLGLLALLLSRNADCGMRIESDPQSALRNPHSAMAPRGFAPLVAAYVVALGLLLFFAAHSRKQEADPNAPVPNLAAVLPAAAAGWEVLPDLDLSPFSSTLQTTTFVQRTYVRGAAPAGTQIKVYIAYWKPGQANPSLVATHTPDGCWPGAGWLAVPADPRRVALRADDRTLPEAEYRLFKSRDFPQHVWYWHLYDGAPIQYVDPYSPRNLLEIAARFGFRDPAPQMFVRISSNKPWSEIGGEDLVRGIISRLQPLGL